MKRGLAAVAALGLVLTLPAGSSADECYTRKVEVLSLQLEDVTIDGVAADRTQYDGISLELQGDAEWMQLSSMSFRRPPARSDCPSSAPAASSACSNGPGFCTYAGCSAWCRDAKWEYAGCRL